MSKKTVFSMSLGCAALLAAWTAFDSSRAPAPRPADPLPPVNARLAEAGPYAERLQMRQKAGDKLVVVQASRVAVKKGQAFIFESALLRRPVAEELRVTVWRGEEKLLEMIKEREILSRNLTEGLAVSQPLILFPEGLRADRVSIEPDGAIMLERDGLKERLAGS